MTHQKHKRRPPPVHEARVFGKLVRAEREAQGLTLEELGARLGITKGAVHQYEKGWRSIGEDTLLHLARALGHPTALALLEAGAARVHEKDVAHV